MSNDWRPIETAPPELRQALVFIPAYNDEGGGDPIASQDIRYDRQPCITVAYRHADGAPWEFERELDANGEWFGDDWCFGWPTHWQPMPNAPTDFADAQARFQKAEG